MDRNSSTDAGRLQVSSIFVPSDLAYGTRGAGADIRPNSTLIFEIELVSIKLGKLAVAPAPAAPATKPASCNQAAGPAK